MHSSQNISRVFQLVAGISLDGRIAGAEKSFGPYSSQEDSDFLQKKIAESDVLLMGRKTYEQHVTKVKKPMIIFTSQAEGGIEITEKDGHIIHLFQDSAQELINLLDAMQYKTVTCLGGSEIYHWCLEQKLATDLFLSIEPVIFGEGKNLLHGGYLQHFSDWKLNSHQQLNDQGTLLMHYQAQYLH